MPLSSAQLLFLHEQNVPLSRVYDATGQSKRHYHDVMKEEGRWLAYGVTPCNAAGHTLRTRNGHCAQCNTAVIAFLRRHDEGGDVYVARTGSGLLVKIGCARSAEQRIGALNATCYGRRSDWELVDYVSLSGGAGLAERLIHQELQNFRVEGSYWREDRWVSCYELFDCPADLAIFWLHEICDIK